MRCIVTEPIDVAHIYPFSMRNLRRPVGVPAKLLLLSWSYFGIKSWYETIFLTDSGTEIVPNLMCLCPNAHRYHERALFALKGDDKGKLRVQSYLLPRNKLSNSIDALARKSYSKIIAAKSAEILERVNTGTLAPNSFNLKRRGGVGLGPMLKSDASCRYIMHDAS